MEDATLLFRISLFHSYYDDGMMKDAQLVPNPDTQAWMERYRLLVQQRNGVFSLYYFGARPVAEMVTHLRRMMVDQPWQFFITYQNPYFNIITELPINWSGSLEYTSQQTTQEAEQTLQLNRNLSSNTVGWPGSIGTLSLFLADLFNENGTIKTTHYVIRMQVRQTYWYYYLFNRSPIKLISPMITNHEDIAFEASEQVTMPTGEEALRFISGNQTFPFQETPKIKLDLVNFPNAEQSNGTQGELGQSRTLRKGLPTPNGNQMGIQIKDGGPHVYSEIYVYL